MNTAKRIGVIEQFCDRAWELAREHGLAADTVEVISARPLTPEEAIGRPDRSDFPILKGKEFMMEARFRESRGQAFTAMPGRFEGTMEDILCREIKTDFDRALIVATANALLSHLDMVQGTIHCRDDGPRRCADGLVEYLTERHGSPRVGVIGLQPALVAALSGHLPVRVTDLDPDNVGKPHSGVLVEGVESTQDVIEWADVVLATGTVLGNDTIDGLLSSKPTVFYGVTIAGVAALLGLERYCPRAT